MRSFVLDSLETKNKRIKAISFFVEQIEWLIDKNIAKQILYELVENVKEYGAGKSVTVSVILDGKSLWLIVENDGGFYLRNDKNHKSRLERLKKMIERIMINKSSDVYGLYSIIEEVTEQSGSVDISADGIKISFTDINKWTDAKIARNNKVKIEITFST